MTGIIYTWSIFPRVEDIIFYCYKDACKDLRSLSQEIIENETAIVDTMNHMS